MREARLAMIDDGPWRTFGATVRGPHHRQCGLPNQDAWLARHNSAGSVLAVCDGLGSRSHAHVGAQSACRAVAEAARHWCDAATSRSQPLLRLVHALWALAVAHEGAENCTTTCLLAHARPDGTLFTAQLGDGLIAVDRPDMSAPVYLEDSERAFSNVTIGLGLPGATRAWRTRTFADVPAGTRVLLATDGIADDLLPEHRDAFPRFVHESYAALAPRRRWRRCARDLRNWPVPHHTDDKTLALLWRTASAFSSTDDV